MPSLFHAMVAVALLLSGSAIAADTTAATDPAADRSAILAMQGEYTIGFAFDETALLSPGYARAEPQRSGGDEIVVVVEDSPEKIVLQHLLLEVAVSYDRCNT